MNYRISTLKIRQSLGDILNRVSLRHDEFIVERKGKAIAALIPVGKMKQLENMARLFLVDKFITEDDFLPEAEGMVLANQAKAFARKK